MPTLPPPLLLVATVLASLLFFFRVQVSSRFHLLFGDCFDGVIGVSIEEHWLGVWQHREAWNRPPWFAPHPDTLGYNDGMLLFGQPYALLRMLGCDPFLASELVNVVMHGIGGVAIFWLARSMFRLGLGLSLLGCALWEVAGNLTVQGNHAALFSASLLPVLMILLSNALGCLGRRRMLAMGVWLAVAGSMFDAWLLTSFYMAWLSGFLLLLQALLALPLLRRHDLQPLRERAARVPFVAAAAVSVAGLAPFLIVYLPKAAETGMHSASEIETYRPRLLDILNPQLLGSRLLAMPWDWADHHLFIHKAVDPNGFAPALIVLALAGIVRILVADAAIRSQTTTIRSLALAVLAALLLLFTAAGWRAVVWLVPGASGVRDVARFLLVLTGPLVLFALYGLQALLPASRPGRALLGAGLACLLLAEEVTTPPVGLHRMAGLGLLASVPPAPAGCRRFFVTGYESIFLDLDTPYLPARQNVDAMLLAVTRHLATPNGYATFNPPDWRFNDGGSPGYLAAMRGYVQAHHLEAGLCRLDLRDLRWAAGAG